VAAVDIRPTAVMRVEHASLRHEVSRLPRVAAGLGEWVSPGTPDQLAAIRQFLEEHLLPHARAEDGVLYPLLDTVMGAAQATATMTADHEEIRQRADGFGALVATIGAGPPTPPEAEALREHMYALWAIVDLHLDKEERILFAILDEQLTAADTRTLNERMEAFAGTQ
jgi:iron-sulfur cluster repair protein YtfE (RIC family)